MIDEIKEILDRLKDSAFNPIVDVPVFGGVSESIDNSQCLEPNECKILLDYITNLQEENEILKKEKKEANNYIKNEIWNYYNDGEIIDRIVILNLLDILNGDV